MCVGYITTGISLFSVGAKTHRKIRIPSEKYFSDGVPSEKYPQKYNDRKIEFFCGFTVRNNFSVGLTRTEKLCSRRLKLIFLCVNPHRNKRIKAQKNTFFSVGLGELTEKFISPRLKKIFLCSQLHRKKELNTQKKIILNH